MAVVSGASRGVGKGVALALGAEGATVYVTGRTLAPQADGLPGSLEETAAEITARGGVGVAVVCDHADDDAVRALFARVQQEQGVLDILVNNAFAIPSGEGLYGTPFWEQPIAYWDTMHQVGLRSHYTASVCAAPLLLASSRGLVANISSFGGAGYQVNVAYGVGKAGVDRLSADMAVDLRPHGVAVVSLYPGVVRTERVLSGELPYSLKHSESAELTGRAVAALSLDAGRMRHSGKVCVVAELAREYGFTDVDGTQPRSLRRSADDTRVHRLVAGAGALRPRLRELAPEIEAARRVPTELAAELAAAGYYRMLVPKELGGGQVPPRVFAETLEALALGDAATGWTVMTGATTGLLAAYVPEGPTRERFRDPAGIYAGVFAPLGKAQVAPGGYRLSGRWPFMSGVDNATLRLVGGLVFDAEQAGPRMLREGGPELRSFFLDAADTEVLDTWHTTGLRGTGSHDVTVRDVFVPDSASVCVLADAPVFDGPLYAFPLFGLLATGVSAVALGIAARAREALQELCDASRPGRKGLGESELTQARVAVAEGELRAARAFLLGELDAVFAEVQRGEQRAASVSQRVRLRLAATHAAHAAKRSTQAFYELGGGRSLYDACPLQRCLRDAQTLVQHVMVADPSWVAPGRALLGQSLNVSQL